MFDNIKGPSLIYYYRRKGTFKDVIIESDVFVSPEQAKSNENRIGFLRWLHPRELPVTQAVIDAAIKEFS